MPLFAPAGVAFLLGGFCIGVNVSPNRRAIVCYGWDLKM
jgi:hypothetical protein